MNLCIASNRFAIAPGVKTRTGAGPLSATQERSVMSILREKTIALAGKTTCQLVRLDDKNLIKIL